MEMFILIILILTTALVLSNYKEMYLYICLVLGSLINDIQSKVEKLLKKGSK